MNAAPLVTGVTLLVSALPLALGFAIGAGVWVVRVAIAAFVIGYEKGRHGNARKNA